MDNRRLYQIHISTKLPTCMAQRQHTQNCMQQDLARLGFTPEIEEVQAPDHAPGAWFCRQDVDDIVPASVLEAVQALPWVDGVGVGGPHLHCYMTGDELQPATAQQLADSLEAERTDGGAGAILVDGRSCYVVD